MRFNGIVDITGKKINIDSTKKDTQMVKDYMLYVIQKIVLENYPINANELCYRSSVQRLHLSNGRRKVFNIFLTSTVGKMNKLQPLQTQKGKVQVSIRMLVQDFK
jgi:hypothetical protein